MVYLDFYLPSFFLFSNIILFLFFQRRHRGSGIAGMWFVPAFFLVGLCYFLVAKALRKIPKLNESGQALIHLGIALTVTIIFRQVYKLDKSLLFSIDQVPIHWFYYALGRVVFVGFQWLKTISKPTRFATLTISVVISFPYGIDVS